MPGNVCAPAMRGVLQVEHNTSMMPWWRRHASTRPRFPSCVYHTNPAHPPAMPKVDSRRFCTDVAPPPANVANTGVFLGVTRGRGGIAAGPLGVMSPPAHDPSAMLPETCVVGGGRSLQFNPVPLQCRFAASVTMRLWQTHRRPRVPLLLPPGRASQACCRCQPAASLTAARLEPLH